MELRHLRHLMAIVEHGSFSRAADAVHLTQSALSRSIQALEAEVGAPVVERQRGDVAPTAIGQLLLDHARRLDIATRDLERDIALTQGLELGELRIGVGPYGGSALVGPPMGQLNRAHPGLRIKTVLAPWQELPERARARDVDLIVLEPSQVAQMEDFTVRPLHEHPMVAVCRPQHPLTQGPAPSATQVFSYPLVGPSLTPAQATLLHSVLPAASRSPSPKRGLLAVECDLSGMLKDVLRHSDAVSLMPDFMVAAEVASGQLVCLPGIDLGVHVRFACAWLSARTLSPAAQRFMALLETHDQALVAHSQATP
ncbi:LysR family transcriptional regulator [Curvibacter sp. APW13]|uniref:LysR family transcriptional regulator n=1 Tax=Curvibacter sp. APW13 TaxID=3077236 RepID=UPI0028E0728F|nr:LysR family transcriptional regulator [Curvibacter sp. APW13]MDT8990949.1 LysR family transcriptional regulator [Curvibacter sp. APW13]